MWYIENRSYNSSNELNIEKPQIEDNTTLDWKKNFEEEWNDISRTENVNSAETNYNNYKNLLSTIPTDASKERKQTLEKISYYESLFEEKNQLILIMKA